MSSAVLVMYPQSSTEHISFVKARAKARAETLALLNELDSAMFLTGVLTFFNQLETTNLRCSR